MTHKTMTTLEAIEYITTDETNDDFAFRGDTFIPAKKFRNSRYHGDDGPEYTLPGVSVVNVPYYSETYVTKAIQRARDYGKIVFLLRGTQTNADEINHDPDEALMQNHKIVAIIRD